MTKIIIFAEYFIFNSKGIRNRQKKPGFYKPGFNMFQKKIVMLFLQDVSLSLFS